MKYRSISLINIGGLTLGMATCITIMLYVTDELSYDRYHEYADRIYRVVLKGKLSDEIVSETTVPSPVAKTFQNEFSEVVLGARLKDYGKPRISHGDHSFRSSRLAFVDPEFLQIFTLPVIQGDPDNSLQSPNTVIITQQTANKYFGSEDPIGKTLDIGDIDQQLVVTGVIENVPHNSHFSFDLFASTVGQTDQQEFAWIQSDGYGYLLLDEFNQAESLERKLPALVEKYMGPQVQQALGMSFEEFRQAGNEVGLFLQPLTDIHLRTNFTEESELEPKGSIKTVYILSAVALFVLIIACINFVNLSTAMATKRAKEVGLKKILGGGRIQLMNQFLLESFLVTSIATILAVILVLVTLPYFNDLSAKSLQLFSSKSFHGLMLIIGLGLITGLCSGMYPAFVLSSYKPISTLKDKIPRFGSGQMVRSSLVVLQFSISVVLIIATLISDLQLSFILNKDLGYEKDNILVIRDSWMLGDQEAILKERLESDTRVAAITRSGYIPAGTSNSSMYNIYPDPNADTFRRTYLYYVDHQYLNTMGMQLISGSDFSQDHASDSSHTIINETAAKLYGLEEDPVGKVITMATNFENGKRDLEIIGVVKDFHFQSMYQPIEPIFMLNAPNSGLIIRAEQAAMAGLIAQAEALWNQFDPGEPFNYTVLDESYRNTYAAESNVRTVLRVFTLLAIFVALIGLFGLVTFTTEQKYKEIGIRKVLGSSVAQIVSLLSRDFLRLITFSLLLAFPAAFYLVKKGLEDFAYRIDIPWWVFILTAVGTVLMAFATIGIKSIQASLTNPVDALRDQ